MLDLGRPLFAPLVREFPPAEEGSRREAVLAGNA